jgi:hypothetical protein
LAFTSVDHGGEAELDPDLKSDSGLCAVGLHDLIEVKGGDMEDDSRLFALSLYCGAEIRSDESARKI